jgi:hypothetical protein
MFHAGSASADENSCLEKYRDGLNFNGPLIKDRNRSARLYKNVSLQSLPVCVATAREEWDGMIKITLKYKVKRRKLAD